MTVWGTELGIAVVLFLLVFPIALLFLAYHHYHRHGTFRGWSAILTTATFMYVTGVVAFTLFPFPDAGTSNCISGDAQTHIQFVPFNSLGDILDVFAATGFPGILTTATFLQVALNVVLLVPLGMLLAYRYKRSFGFTVLAGLGVSLLIEITQGTAIYGAFDCPYRLADVDDLIANTAGAALGWVIASTLLRWLPDPTPPADSDLDQPRISRRLFAGALDVLALALGGIVVRGIILSIFHPSVELTSGTWATATMTLLDTVLVMLVLFLFIPMLRRDRATPGQIVTWLAEVSIESGHRATPRQVSVRFAVRWLPIAVGVFIQPLLFLACVIAYETTTTLVRNDHRSLSSVVAGTRTVTRRSLEDADTPQQPKRHDQD